MSFTTVYRFMVVNIAERELQTSVYDEIVINAVTVSHFGIYLCLLSSWIILGKFNIAAVLKPYRICILKPPRRRTYIAGKIYPYIFALGCAYISYGF